MTHEMGLFNAWLQISAKYLKIGKFMFEGGGRFGSQVNVVNFWKSDA